MPVSLNQKLKLALVFGTVPSVEEIDQFRLLAETYDVSVVTSASIVEFLTQNSYFQDLRCVALPDYDENPSYLPGLEKALCEFDVVVVKERLGLYAYQTVKAKWRKRFSLVVWVDNLIAFPGDDVGQMRTIRQEITDAADAFLVQTKAARQALLLEGVADERIVDMLPWVEARAKRNGKSKAKGLEALGLVDGDFVVAYLGQIEWEEGLLELAQAAKLAMSEDAALSRRLRMVFCGVGSFAQGLRERLVRLGLDDRAVFVAPSRAADEAIAAAADAIYLAPLQARDRVDGDPYRLLKAMAQEIPVIAHRSPVVEELCGKHRLDFCAGSPQSLAAAIVKASDAAALVHDITRKNSADVAKQFGFNAVATQMKSIFAAVSAQAPRVAVSTLDHQVLEVETNVQAKQYLAAIDLIDAIFKQPTVPVHHRANLYRLVGDCFTKLGDAESGKNAYVEAIGIDPYAARAYIGLGTIALTKGNNDAAVLYFQKAVSLAPEDEMANLGLGLAFQGVDELKEAARWVVKSLELAPDNAAAIYTIVKLAYVSEQYADAERALRRYLECKPDDYNMAYTLGGILFQMGQNAEAATIVQRLVDADPADARAVSLLKQIKRAGLPGAGSSKA